MYWRRQILTICFVAGVLALQPAEAQRYRAGQPSAADAELGNAVSRARERTGGRVLSAETRELNGRRVHIIRILTDDGRVRRMQLDADEGPRGAPPRRR